MYNRERLRAAVWLKGETMTAAAAVMGISRQRMYRKDKSGKWSREEMERFCRHYQVNPLDVFFDGMERDEKAEREFERLAEEWTRKKGAR